jgi:hypothetical protein
VVPYLFNFVGHFMDRFLEMAAGDIDDNVALAVVQMLRSMQK